VRRIVEHAGACSVYRLDPSSNQVGDGT
jgi:hypothetical protein